MSIISIILLVSYVAVGVTLAILFIAAGIRTPKEALVIAIAVVLWPLLAGWLLSDWVKATGARGLRR